MIFKKLILLILLFISLFCSVYSYQGEHEVEINNAINFLKTCQKQDGGFGESDSSFSSFGLTNHLIVTLVAAGEDPNLWLINDNDPVSYIKQYYTRLEGAFEYKMIIDSLLALGENPHNVYGEDLYSENKRLLKEDSQQYSYYYRILTAVGANDNDEEYINDAINYFKDKQFKDGGWPWDIPNPILSDPLLTGLVIQALVAAGEDPNSKYIQDAVNFIKSNQLEDGGIYGIGSSVLHSDLITTTYALRGMSAAGENLLELKKNQSSIIDFILNLQTRDGSFNKTIITNDNSPCSLTGYAILSLLGKPEPILPNKKVSKIKINSLIENNQFNDVYYDISNLEDSSISNFLKVYFPDMNFDSLKYRINFNLVEKDYQLKNGDYLLISKENKIPLRLSLKRKFADEKLYMIDVGSFKFNEVIIALTEYYDEINKNWKPLKDVIVIYDETEYKTNENGKVEFKLDQSGIYDIYSSKEGYFNSEKLKIHVSNPNEIKINLRIEGENSTIFNGDLILNDENINMTGQTNKIIPQMTPFGAIITYLSENNINYQISDDSSLEIEEINFEKNSDAKSWIWIKNGKHDDGCWGGSYELNDGDELIWYYGSTLASVIDFDFKEDNLAGNYIIKVISYDHLEDVWENLSFSQVYVNNVKYLTDKNGILRLNESKESMTLNIYADKENYLRSELKSYNLSKDMLGGNNYNLLIIISFVFLLLLIVLVIFFNKKNGK